MSSITTENNIFGEKPYLRGRRIAVHQILEAVDRDDYSREEVVEDLYPQLSVGEVDEALEFAEEYGVDALLEPVENDEQQLRERERESKSRLEGTLQESQERFYWEDEESD